MRSRRIIKHGRNCWAVEPVGRTGIIIDGRDYYSAFYHAARQAREFILISGWQFDSDVKLLRGDDMKEAFGETSFLGFLNGLCEKNPALRVYILAWDFSVVFTFERARKWLRSRVFGLAHRNISFHLDHNHAFAASQHQKFVVIDGCMAFVGGMDICSGRWDERPHLAYNPNRVDANRKPYGPYHDTHSYHTGDVVEKLTRLFESNWRSSTGSSLRFARPGGAFCDYLAGVEFGLPVRAGCVAVSRTMARSIVRQRKPIREIRSLYVDAIRSAKRLIYIENQFFTSYAVYRALARRMKSGSGPGLQVVIVLPKKEQTFLERIYAGIAQSKLLRSLERVARRHGHRLGVYYTAAPAGDGTDVPVYIHSKIMVVDDVFLTIGSANTNNRGMGLDTELNVAWEAADGRQTEPAPSIKNIRVELLSEHTGLTDEKSRKRLSRAEGLVEYLDRLSMKPGGRLRRHRLHRSHLVSRLLGLLRLDRIIIDPERAVIDEGLIRVYRPFKSPLARKVAYYLRRLFPF